MRIKNRLSTLSYEIEWQEGRIITATAITMRLYLFHYSYFLCLLSIVEEEYFWVIQINYIIFQPFAENHVEMVGCVRNLTTALVRPAGLAKRVKQVSVIFQFFFQSSFSSFYSDFSNLKKRNQWNCSMQCSWLNE